MEVQDNIAAPKLSTKYSTIKKYSGIFYCVLAWILVICIVIQVSLAALAIFVDMAIWVKHMYFIYVFEFFPVIMFLLGCAAGFPRHLNRPNFVLFILINVQYHTADGWIGVVHTLFAIVLFMLSLSMAQRSYRFVFKNNEI